MRVDVFMSGDDARRRFLVSWENTRPFPLVIINFPRFKVIFLVRGQRCAVVQFMICLAQDSISIKCSNESLTIAWRVCMSQRKMFDWKTRQLISCSSLNDPCALRRATVHV